LSSASLGRATCADTEKDAGNKMTDATVTIARTTVKNLIRQTDLLREVVNFDSKSMNQQSL